MYKTHNQDNEIEVLQVGQGPSETSVVQGQGDILKREELLLCTRRSFLAT
jgi:hypothetical protein